jgi:hypothetical protein
MLAFARPYFKAGEKTNKQFSHYENYYKCSRYGYEIRGGKKENTNPIKMPETTKRTKTTREMKTETRSTLGRDDGTSSEGAAVPSCQ